MIFSKKGKSKNKHLDRQELKQRILKEIQPGKTRILKTDGGRRPVTANDGERVTMRVGVKTNATKTTTIDMVKFAYDTTRNRGRFDSSDFNTRFPRQYSSGPCIYSMTGGLLVELDLATLMKEKNRNYYGPR